MRIFDDRGMMIFPSPMTRELRESPKVLVVQECFCPNGHNLVSPRVRFNRFPGIMFKVRLDEGDGLVALSPIFGDKSRITLDVDLVKDSILTPYCPHCDIQLPTYGPCGCGGDLAALFTTRSEDFGNCVGVCTRVDCYNAEVHNANELLTLSTVRLLAERGLH